MEREYVVDVYKEGDAVICKWTDKDTKNGSSMSIRFLTDVDFIDFCNVIEIAKQQFVEKKSNCFEYIGILNEPHTKCKSCGREEWQHKYISK